MDLCNPGMEPVSPALQGNFFFQASYQGSPAKSISGTKPCLPAASWQQDGCSALCMTTPHSNTQPSEKGLLPSYIYLLERQQKYFSRTLSLPPPSEQFLPISLDKTRSCSKVQNWSQASRRALFGLPQIRIYLSHLQE